MSAHSNLGINEIDFTLETYLKLSSETAIYPQDCKQTYPSLGLADEVGEFLEKFIGLENPMVLTLDQITDLGKELGDICWYISATARDSGVGLINMLPSDLGEIHHNIRRHVKDPSTAGYKMVFEAAKVCGHVKKCKRDNADRRGQIGIHLFNLVYLVAFFADLIGLDIEWVMQENINKLFDRKNRGVLKGDGDNR